jgi:hypothetical protein
MKTVLIKGMMVFFFLIGWQYSLAQMHSSFKTGNPIFHSNNYIIPFQLRGHMIYVKVKLNNSSKNYNFILDTGAFTSIDEETSTELGLEKGFAYATSGKIKSAYQLKDGVTIALGEVVVQNFKISMMDLAFFKQSQPHLDGFLGSNFLRFFNVLIDYQKKQISLSRSPEYRQSAHKTYRMKLNTNNQAGLPKIACQVNYYWQAQALIDTGSPFAITFPLSFCEKFSRSERQDFIESKGVFASWPWTQIEKNYLGKIKSIKLGDLEINNLPVLFANTEDIILGKEFLDQFMVCLNYPAHEAVFYLTSRLRFNKNYFSSGLKLKKDAYGRTVVEAIWADSPASRRGIDVDDEIIKINEREAKNLSESDIYRILNDDRIAKIQLVLKKSYRQETVILQKRGLLPQSE